MWPMELKPAQTPYFHHSSQGLHSINIKLKKTEINHEVLYDHKVPFYSHKVLVDLHLWTVNERYDQTVQHSWSVREINVARRRTQREIKIVDDS